MIINVNNKQHQIKDSTSLEVFLATSNIHHKGIAIAINNMVIAKQEWSTTFLANGDAVTIIHATQGG